MKKRNCFKHIVLFTLLAIVFALFSVAFVSNNAVASADDFVVTVENQVLTSVDGDFVGSKIESAVDALEYLNKFKDDFGFNDAKEHLKSDKVVQSLTGTVYKYYQYIGGTRVYGGALNVGTNKYKRIVEVNGKYYINPEYDSQINISEDDGVEIVKAAYQGSEVDFEEKVILLEDNCKCIAFIYYVAMPEENLRVFISASSGQVVKEVGVNTLASERKNTIAANGYKATSETISVTIDGETVNLPVTKYTSTKSGGGYFYALSDAAVAKIYMTKGNGSNNANDLSTYTYICYDSDTLDSASLNYGFSDKDVLKAYESILTCYNFYKDGDYLGISIDGIKNKDGKKIDLIAIVHFGSNYENAGYVEPSYNNGKYETFGYFLFGDGRNGSTNSFVNGLDIVGHEYQHAITSSAVALEYSKESGALSEAYSDMFGAVIEGKGIASSDFWKLGEDVVQNGVGYLRNMANPSATNCVSYYSQVSYYTNRSTDYGGVHTVCTLPTYATYLMYKKAPTMFTEKNILKLWYQTLTQYLTDQSGILDFCSGMMKAADDLEFGEDMKNVIEYAFAMVGIPGYYTTKTWDNNGLTVFEGDGTIVSPYLINSVADLASLAYYVNKGEGDYASARYKLTKDLDLGDVSWIAIGTVAHPFDGYFNGGSFTIRGLNLAGKQGDVFNGLFAYVGENGFIYDLNIDSGATETQAEYVGAIAGRLLGGISGCSSALSITGTNVGGLVGILQSSGGGQKIANCFVNADLTGDKVGGLVCIFGTSKNTDLNLVESSYITSNYYQGKITAEVAGGLIADANGVYVINNLVYATFDGQNRQTTIGGLIANLDFVNSINEKAVQNVYNYVLTNRIYANYLKSNQAEIGLVVAYAKGNLGEGQTLISGNIAKKVGNFNIVYNAENALVTTLENNKLSDDHIFEGDFDFDNEKYYQNQDWTVLSQSASFDLIGTFKTAVNKMPNFKQMEFWLSGTAVGFDGGDGSESNPFQISNAEQLATLAILLTQTKSYSIFMQSSYQMYSSQHYILTADIDLDGKVWAGIGFATYRFVKNVLGEYERINNIYPFTGTFDGNGHTIKNMKTLGVYSVQGSSDDYTIYEFLPGLFSYTGLSSYTEAVDTPTIKNLSLENVEASGNYAAAIVGRAFVELNLENIKVMGGEITSSGIAGGLVAKVEGFTDVTNSAPEINIKDCYTLVDIAANVAGGAVGYATNGTGGKSSTINIINFLGKNNINIIGVDKEAVFDGVYAYPEYYKAIGGNVVGVSLVKNLNIINSVILGDVVSYTQGAYMGAFVGAVGAGDALTGIEVNINIDACKHMGQMHYILNKTSNAGGIAVGGTHQSLISMVNISVNNKTYTNVDAAAVYYNNSNSISISSDFITSTDSKGTGVFDFYNKDYYQNNSYFNLNYAWSQSDIDRMQFVVTFMLEDGTVLKQQAVKDGSEVVPPEVVPVKESTIAYEYKFIGFDKDYTNITQDTVIYAVYEEVARKYQVTYEDENGKVLAVLDLDFGTPVDQEIEFVQKQGNAVINYTFLRFGEKGQTVAGNTTVRPVYKTEVTKIGVIAITTIIAGMFAIYMFFQSKGRTNNNQ